MSKRRKLPVQFSAGFFLLAAWFGAANGWQMLGMVLGSALLHEAGHWGALYLLGGRVNAVRIGVLGAVMEMDSDRLSYAQELLVVLAGPGMNLLCAGLGLWIGDRKWLTAIGGHLTLGAFNLLPIRPLDGGRALYLLTCWISGPMVGERLCRLFGTITGAVLAGFLCVCMWCSRGSLWLLPAAAAAIGITLREGFGKTAFL